MSDSQEKKPGKGSKFLGWVILIIIIAAVWQGATGGGSSSSSSSSASTEAIEDIKHSPAARVSDRSQAINFVIQLRAQGVDERGVAASVQLLRSAGLDRPADLIAQANREIGD